MTCKQILRTLIFGTLILIMLACAPRFPQKRVEFNPFLNHDSSQIANDEIGKNYQVLNTNYIKRKPKLMHLHWNKPIVPFIIADSDIKDDPFHKILLNGFSTIKRLAQVNVIWDNYYRFEPNIFIIYVKRDVFSNLNNKVIISDQCDLYQSSQNIKIGNPVTGVPSKSVCLSLSGNQKVNAQFGYLQSWVDMIQAMARNQHPVNNGPKRMSGDDLCGVYLSPHFKNGSLIDKAVFSLPSDLPINLKKRCFHSILVRGMGLINGFYHTPFHGYNYQKSNTGVMGLYPDRYEKQLLKLGPSILNQEHAFSELTEQDKWFIQIHYHNQRNQTPDFDELKALTDSILAKR